MPVVKRTFVESTTGAEGRFDWDWLGDIESGAMQGLEVEYNGGVFRQAHGFLASSVTHSPGDYTSERDASTLGKLRSDLVMLTLPELTDVVVFPDLPDEYLLLKTCLFFDCHSAIHWPWEGYMEAISRIRNLVNEPMLVLHDPDSDLPFATTQRAGEAYRIDFGELAPSVDAWTFPNPEESWLHISPEETMSLVIGSNVDSRSMLLATTGTRADRAYRVYSDVQDGYLIDGANGGWGLAAKSSEAVEMPLNGKAVYSALRNELLLVGGTDIVPSSRIRRYLPDSHELEVVSVESRFAPGHKVLGAALDPSDNVLYVLDLDSDEAEARLTVHDLNGATSRRIWTVPYAGVYVSTDLSVREDRQLVLSVTDGLNWTAWSIDPRAERARFTGRVDGEGRPVNAPVMGVHALSIPVQTQSGVHFEKLPVERFQGGAACVSL